MTLLDPADWAWPDEIDAGPHAGISDLFADRIHAGLAVMAALPAEQRARATVYAQMVDPAMPPGRVHPGDERHLAGAFQDNRVIPVEGVCLADVPETAHRRVLDVVATFVRLLPEGPRAARMREVEAHLNETWFSWIGGHRPGDVFYYRVQSPVLIAELDHHCGVFLDYDTPETFHIHTVLSTPTRQRLRPGLGPAVAGESDMTSPATRSAPWCGPGRQFGRPLGQLALLRGGIDGVCHRRGCSAAPTTAVAAGSGGERV